MAENEVLTEFYAPCLSEKSINKLPEQIRRVLHPSTEEKAGLKKMSEGWKKVEKNEGKASEGMNPEMAKKFYDKIKPQND